MMFAIHFIRLIHFSSPFRTRIGADIVPERPLRKVQVFSCVESLGNIWGTGIVASVGDIGMRRGNVMAREKR